MTELLLKDLRITRHFLLPAMAFYAMFVTGFIFSRETYLLAHLLFAFGFAAAFPSIEFFLRTEATICALPVRRSDIVTGRYLTSLIFIAVCGGMFMIHSRVLRAAAGGELRHMASDPAPLGGLVFVLAALILVSAFFPFLFKLGLGKGLLAFGSSVLGLLLISTAVRLISGGAPAAMLRISRAADGTPKTYLPILSDIVNMEHSLTNPAFLAVAVFATSAVAFISIRLSVRFYEKKDL